MYANDTWKKQVGDKDVKIIVSDLPSIIGNKYILNPLNDFRFYSS